jgi:2-iminoacetate synthase ThiH
MVEYTIKKGSKHQNRRCGYCDGRMTPGRKFVLDPERYENQLPMIFHPQCREAWVKRGKQPLCRGNCDTVHA